ncbi:Alpha/beta hydrolase of unknown function [Pseudooceanicola antarcticus]|uniref:Alpha/beta hydrolase n=1 Tax=Pseudooceanicola antarcticus TaxID=1247613 RepID=A0A285IR81_9RHOB|nr:alpha/beta hydrolase [Pseudooceanicola antarcticus]PJE31752.1 alpha/beta hydrolase [Pseudooceanicola antarcticus]SNY50343.1 Alpha/beta hydrolase of unknown function [Pseudooceanicola antarcticus]
MDYVFCVRGLSGGGFSDEPGGSRFLAVPENQQPVPDHKIKKKAWIEAVIQESRHGPQDELPRGDILMYVHGFNTPQDVMIERHRLLKSSLAALGFEGVVISFDWPCADQALNYLEDREDAKITALRMVREGIAAFAQAQRPDCRINLHILAHSMGAFVTREAFDDADDRPRVAAHSWSVSQVMLISGDVSAGSMAEGGKAGSLYRHCVRLTNYFNPFDAALSLSNVKRVGVAPRVGRIGLPETAPASAVNVNVGNYFDANKARFAGLKNASHTWYFHDERFLRDVLLTMQGEIDRHEIPGRAQGSLGNLVLV